MYVCMYVPGSGSLLALPTTLYGFVFLLVVTSLIT
jgi:hypothetical protein